jgi:DNA-binding transcriptional regulator YdaS (Cro superfamily)
MNDKSLTQIELAEILHIHHVYLNAILRGRKTASVPLSIKIEEATDGAIKATDLRPELKFFQKNAKKGEPSVETEQSESTT